MQTAAEAAAGEAADEGEEEDADADDTRYGFAPCHCTVVTHGQLILHVRLCCPSALGNGIGTGNFLSM